MKRLIILILLLAIAAFFAEAGILLAQDEKVSSRTETSSKGRIKAKSDQMGLGVSPESADLLYTGVPREYRWVAGFDFVTKSMRKKLQKVQ